ncbi:response regulator transcription factor [Rhizobium sp. PAMB 3182]
MDNSEFIRVLILDENPVLADGLAALLNSTKNLRAVRPFDAIDDVSIQVSRLRPDVLVTDPEFLERSVPAGLVAVSEASRQTRALAYCAVTDPHSSRHYMNLGYAGVVPKTASVQKILKAINVLGHGGLLEPPEEMVEPITYRAESTGLTGAVSASAPRGPLTDREEAVLRYVAMGLATKEIAADISLSQKTVETYKSRAVKKLSLSSRSEIVQYAIRNGWLS